MSPHPRAGPRPGSSRPGGWLSPQLSREPGRGWADSPVVKNQETKKTGAFF